MSEAVIHQDGRVVMGAQQWRAALGRAGTTAHKQEGDEATPEGVLTLRRVLYRADRLSTPRSSVRREPIAPEDGWCDDRYDTAYNTQVRLPYAGRHEVLWRDDPLYDIIGILGWNDAPVIKGDGSAIFLHVARRDLAPTQGCIALVLADLQAMLAAGITALRVLPRL